MFDWIYAGLFFLTLVVNLGIYWTVLADIRSVQRPGDTPKPKPD